MDVIQSLDRNKSEHWKYKPKTEQKGKPEKRESIYIRCGQQHKPTYKQTIEENKTKVLNLSLFYFGVLHKCEIFKVKDSYPFN
jgi:hypothetical protein